MLEMFNEFMEALFKCGFVLVCGAADQNPRSGFFPRCNGYPDTPMGQEETDGKAGEHQYATRINDQDSRILGNQEKDRI